MRRCAIQPAQPTTPFRGHPEAAAPEQAVAGPVPAGLRDAAVYATRERSAAEALGEPLLGPHRLHTAGGSTPFWASLHAAPIGRASVAHLALGQATEVVLVAPPRFLVVVPGHGRAAARTAAGWSTATPRRAVVLAPGTAATIRCEASSAHLVVGIERQSLLTHLSRLLGRALDRPLDFDDAMELSAPEAHRWNVAVGLLHHELAESRSLLRRGIGPSQLDEFLMSALLYGHRSTYSAALRVLPQGAARVAIRTATDFIETHLDQPLSLAAVASAAGLSARTLQVTFRSELQTTPTAYIRDRRLERVRAELAAASSSGAVTVTEVATRWGINHLGRFAVDYRARFGESPSQTLRGSPRSGSDRFLHGCGGYARLRPQAKEEAVADERDPVAGMLNREGKGGEESDAANANYTDAHDVPDGQGVMGTGQDPQHRAPAGDGFRAPLAEKSDAPPQYSSFDSKGNERVVVLGTNEKGQPAQGVGPDTASAKADAESGTSQIGDMGADE